MPQLALAALLGCLAAVQGQQRLRYVLGRHAHDAGNVNAVCLGMSILRPRASCSVPATAALPPPPSPPPPPPPSPPPPSPLPPSPPPPSPPPPSPSPPPPSPTSAFTRRVLLSRPPAPCLLHPRSFLLPAPLLHPLSLPALPLVSSSTLSPPPLPLPPLRLLPFPSSTLSLSPSPPSPSPPPLLRRPSPPSPPPPSPPSLLHLPFSSSAFSPPFLLPLPLLLPLPHLHHPRAPRPPQGPLPRPQGRPPLPQAAQPAATTAQTTNAPPSPPRPPPPPPRPPPPPPRPPPRPLPRPPLRGPPLLPAPAPPPSAECRRARPRRPRSPLSPQPPALPAPLSPAYPPPSPEPPLQSSTPPQFLPHLPLGCPPSHGTAPAAGAGLPPPPPPSVNANVTVFTDVPRASATNANFFYIGSYGALAGDHFCASETIGYLYNGTSFLSLGRDPLLGAPRTSLMCPPSGRPTPAALLTFRCRTLWMSSGNSTRRSRTRRTGFCPRSPPQISTT